MTVNPPSHTCGSRDAGGRLHGRPRGDSRLRARGRDSESSPLRVPVARVRWIGGPW